MFIEGLNRLYDIPNLDIMEIIYADAINKLSTGKYLMVVAVDKTGDVVGVSEFDLTQEDRLNKKVFVKRGLDDVLRALDNVSLPSPKPRTYNGQNYFVSVQSQYPH